MHCWRCGWTVAPGTTQCPRCQTPLFWAAPPTNRHGRAGTVAIVVIGLVVGLVSIGALASAVVPKPTPTAAPAVGQPMSVNRDGKVFTITVDSVKESDYPTGSTPRPGYKLLSVMVTYKAAHSSEDASYSEWDWSAKAAGHKINTYSQALEPSLGVGSLYADGTASGYVTFEVPTSGEVRVGYWFLSFDTDPTFELVVRP
jgi:hypothetical protein